ncbi:MAG TPA: winged helix-turn-helix transcriptional regulator [Candidatus Nitrosotalea sp.]|nr:winged helix-turn-helix transcriptional regulator [Nitrososphaerota archaeon]HKU32331.1 winged helix-turn-helix transcriptional regulator [Candidatus Nitrosotalea sp.]
MANPTTNEDRILEYIQRNPGCHLRRIKNDLDMSMGTTQYHLNSLEKAGKIISERHSLHRFYFPVGIFELKQKNIMKILNQDTLREILLFIIERKNPTQTEISERIKITAASVNWHIKRLLELGIVNETREGKFKRYEFVGSPSHIIKILKEYHPSLWNSWSDRLAEMFLSLHKDGKET